MTIPDSSRRLQSRRVALAACGIGVALVAATTAATTTDTIATFTDNVWAGGAFNASKFGIESSLSQNENYANHSDSPLTLNFSEAIAIAPGEVKYSGFYIRRTLDSESFAKVTLSEMTGESESSSILWSGHLTMVAKYAPVAEVLTTCGDHINDNPAWQTLYSTTTFSSAAPVPGASFTLGEETSEVYPDGRPYMVCFEFTLDPNVVTNEPTANGHSVKPTWTFTAESVTPEP